jgi:bifunctional NMN adenylyltransferase/nudix hydrolase
MPGRGLWALPGGFLDQGETLAAAAVRELQEETGIAVTLADVREHRVFDDPERSLRGRTIPHVYRFALDERATMPAAQGGDDAAAAAWIGCTELSPMQLFEDHYAILQVLLGLP